MLLASLVISARDWLLPAVGFLAVALLVLYWAYRTAPAAGSVRFLCVFLKALGLIALAVCLLEPLWSGQRARPGANQFAIVADNSMGMQIHDRDNPQSRGEFLRGLLTTEKSVWQAKLEENFQVRRYLFDSRLQPTETFSELVLDGRSSAIFATLRTLAERYQGRPLAGVLLLTDGNATDLGATLPDLVGLPPIYPVVIGNDQPIKDIAVNNVTVTQTSFEDAPVSIQADVSATGYSGANLVAQLLDPSGKKVEEQIQKAKKDGELIAFRFNMRPEKGGVTFYRLRVSAKEEVEQFANPKAISEATLANNTRVLVVDRGKGPYRVLYVTGRPNWEYKFLHRAIDEDDQVQLFGLIRVANREPKFDFRGHAGESSNPLFRGFDKKDEATERYDQPVVIRIYPNEEARLRDENKLRGGFPKLPEDLYTFHAVILDDLEAGFFTPDQMLLLQKFVSERGGGLLMLGGTESFQQGKYLRTPIGDMLPVYLDRAVEAKELGHLRLSLTKEGWLQPWARLRNNEEDEKTRVENMPPFFVLNQMNAIKPGASPIATVHDSSGKIYPALVVQRFGNGRAAALAIGDFWHWGLRDKEVHRDLDKAWRQMVRWLVADVPNRVTLQSEQNRGEPNQPVLLQVRVRDQKFQPLDNASVTLRILSISSEAKPDKLPGSSGTFALTNAARLNAEPALVEPGLYQTTYIPRDTGGYKAEAVVTNSVGAEVGRAEVGWTSDPAAEEFRSLKPNRALLETIAKRTGGEVIAANRLEEFAASMPHRNVPVIENWSLPLWHRSSVFLFALACFVAEWGLRRWKGLA